MADDDPLAELAAYHVGLFAGAAGRIDASPAFIAHALVVLVWQAEMRRREWLEESDA